MPKSVSSVTDEASKRTIIDIEGNNSQNIRADLKARRSERLTQTCPKDQTDPSRKKTPAAHLQMKEIIDSCKELTDIGSDNDKLAQDILIDLKTITLADMSKFNQTKVREIFSAFFKLYDRIKEQENTISNLKINLEEFVKAKEVESEVAKNGQGRLSEQHSSALWVNRPGGAFSTSDTPLFSDMLKKSQNVGLGVDHNPVNTLIVTSSEPECSAEDIRKEIYSRICPIKNKLKIQQARVLRSSNKVIFRCHHLEDIKKLKRNIEENPDLKHINCTEPKKLLPRVLILGVQNDIEKEELPEKLIAQNDLDMEKSAIRPLFNMKAAYGECNWVCEVTPQAFQLLIRAGRVYLGMVRCRVEKHIKVTKCFRCCEIGHVQKYCTKNQVCSKCSGEHNYRDCSAEVPKCVNCCLANLKIKKKVNVSHPSTDEKCPTAKFHLNRLLEKIDFGI